MRIGIFGGVQDPAGASVDDCVTAARQAAADGFPSYWVPQIFGLDALTVLAVVGREVPDIELGTAVVPTYPRHPMMLAAQALTVQSATGNRLTLGIGLSHQIVVESMWGYSFEKPVRHMREYLEVLRPLVSHQPVTFVGETVQAMTFGPLEISNAEPCPILLAALGTQMLQLAATKTDGTITWMTGPDTLRGHIVPTITAAAIEAGRPAPRVVAGLPVAVTADVAAARERAAAGFAVYGQLPSYRAMLDREGAAGPADVAIVGTADEVRAGIERVAEAGATDFIAVEFAGGADRDRTRDLLRSLVGHV